MTSKSFSIWQPLYLLLVATGLFWPCTTVVGAEKVILSPVVNLLLAGRVSDPTPEPTPTCANHKITLCDIWTENITGYEEVGRKILPDCTLEFYEFGDHYYTGTWKPISEATVLLHNRLGDINGTYINSNKYKEDYWTYSCGTRF